MLRNFAGNIGTGGKELGPDGSGDDRLLSDRQVAALLGCGRATVWRYVGNGILPRPLKIGGLTRWRMSALAAVVELAEREGNG